MKKILSLIITIFISLSLIAVTGCNNTEKGYDTLKNYIIENDSLVDRTAGVVVDYSDKDGLTITVSADYGMAIITINPNSKMHDVEGFYITSSTKVTAATAQINAKEFCSSKRTLYNIVYKDYSYIPSYGTAGIENIFKLAINLALVSAHNMIVDLELGITIKDLGYKNILND